MPHTGLILLAAGGSSRLGRPKQLLDFDGTTLLERAVDAASSSQCDPIIVVIGASAQLMRSRLGTSKADSKVHIEENANWSGGLSTSLRSGIRKLRQLAPNADGAVIMACDQPFVSTEIINSLIERFSATGCKIVASSYAGTLGVPALFAAELFDEIATLSGDSGAKILIRKYPQHVLAVDCPKGDVDIDTCEDYNRLALPVVEEN